MYFAEYTMYFLLPLSSMSTFFIYLSVYLFIFFFFNDTATTEIYTLSYTTLFRSNLGAPTAVLSFVDAFKPAVISPSAEDGELRSEEHTSELQSQSNLVCRLLLEKKKKKNKQKKHKKKIIQTPKIMYTLIRLTKPK